MTQSSQPEAQGERHTRKLDPWLTFACMVYAANLVGWLVWAVLHRNAS